MQHSDFRIGMEFTCSEGTWRVTDVGSRVIVAIRLDSLDVRDEGGTETTLSRQEAEQEGWFNGPPYAVVEVVFDEDDFEACEPV